MYTSTGILKSSAIRCGQVLMAAMSPRGVGSSSRFEDERDLVEELAAIGSVGPSLSLSQVQRAMTLITAVFRSALRRSGFPDRGINALCTKFRDAGRRSAPWRPTSSRLPGRPQDGADGNRIARWLLPDDHKFYADERNATLVEIRYYLQALSMQNAPAVSDAEALNSWDWLLEGTFGTGEYLDPIRLVPIDFLEVFATPRMVTSGHLIPLDRGGKHEPHDTFLTLRESNNLQGNLTLEELLESMYYIIEAHRQHRSWEPESK